MESAAMKPLVIGIGELLWDLLPAGPEMGGAPANFACHARALGADAAVISAVGDDAAGAGLLERLEGLGVRTEGVAVHPDLPTGSVGVELDDEGQPDYTIHADTGWDRLVAGPRQMELVGRASAVCFGTLAQRSEESGKAILSLVAAADAKALKVLDVNFRAPFFSKEKFLASVELADVLKLNEGELVEIAGMLGFGEQSMKQAFDELMARFNLRLIACTRGSRGSVLYDGKQWLERSGIPVQASDTVGAGDSFTAAVTMGLLMEWPIEKISEMANEVAAFVCSRSGAVPRLPDELRNRFYEECRNFETAPVEKAGMIF
jgi:fructokinase